MDTRPSTASSHRQGIVNLKDWSLSEVAATVVRQLEAVDVPVVVVGGSAVTVHVPHVYTSSDIDFAALRDATIREFAAGVVPLGFARHGRVFVNPTSAYTLDLVGETPFVDRRPIREFDSVRTRRGPVRVLRFSDAVADRVAAFVHWADEESLDVAARAVSAYRGGVPWAAIVRAIGELDVDDRASSHRRSSALAVLRSERARR